MKFLQGAVAAMAIFASSSAWGSTTITQDFVVSNTSHGNDPRPSIDQYSGPLTLESVSIEWSGFAGSWGRNANPTGKEEEFYTLNYFSTLDFEAYTADIGVFSSGFFTFSQSAECSQYYCEIYAAAGDIVTPAPWFFVGADKIYFDSTSMNEVSFADFDEWLTYGGAIGTVTYVLSDATAPAPEPSTWALLLVGFAAVGSAVRRRRGLAVSPGL